MIAFPRSLAVTTSRISKMAIQTTNEPPLKPCQTIASRGSLVAMKKGLSEILRGNHLTAFHG